MRARALIACGLLLTACGGRGGVGALDQTNVRAEREDGVQLWLEPTRARYDVAGASHGNVELRARFVNHGGEPTVIAHPSACISHEPAEGEALVQDAEASFMEIRIATPDGRSLTYRNAPIGGFLALRIESGAEAELPIDRLGDSFAQARWTGIHAPIFDLRGEYRLRLVYRNRQPLAYVNRPSSGYDVLRPFVGELLSTEAVIHVE